MLTVISVIATVIAVLACHIFMAIRLFRLNGHLEQAKAHLSLARQAVMGAMAQLEDAKRQLLAAGRPAEASSPWRPLVGNRLELGDSGFAIHHAVNPGRGLFSLYLPSGHLFVDGCDLAALKQIGERLERDLREFHAPSVAPIIDRLNNLSHKR